MAELKQLGVIGLISLLVGFGGAGMINEDSLKYAFVCNNTLLWGIFQGGLSSTGVTAYPVSKGVNGVSCSKGKWIGLSTYAEGKGVDPVSFIINMLALPPPVVVTGVTYTCNFRNCTRIR